MKSRIFDDFDPYASDYRTIHNEQLKASGADSLYFAKMKVELVKKNESGEVLQVLDVGCGDGATASFMNTLCAAWQIHGVDISEKSIEIAKKKSLSNARFEVYDGLHFPAKDNSYDIVFISCVLHHVTQDLHTVLLNEIRRVLKKRGRLYIFEHNPLNPYTKYLVNKCPFDKDAKLLSYVYSKKLAKLSHFRLDFCRFIIFFPRKGILKSLIFLEKIFTGVPLGGQYYIRAIK